MTWAILGLATAGYFAFLVAVLGVVANAPRNFIVLHINEDGDLEPADSGPLVADAEMNAYLAHLFDQARRKTAGGRPDQVKTLVVLTAPDELPYRHVWRILHATRRVGFTRWDLRKEGEDQMPEALPTPDQPSPPDPAAPTAQDLAFPYEVTVCLRTGGAKEDGDLAAIVVRTPDGESALADLDTLRRFLRLKRNDGLLTMQQVRIQADADLQYRFILDTVRQCQRAGCTAARYAPPPDWVEPDGPDY
jgi:biopolymer transport protein ExbD